MSDKQPPVQPWMEEAAKEVGHMHGAPWDQKATIIAKHYAESLHETLLRGGERGMVPNPKFTILQQPNDEVGRLAAGG